MKYNVTYHIDCSVSDIIIKEFIIRTRRSRYPDVYVARRYGDFRTFAAEVKFLCLPPIYGIHHGI